MFVYEQTDKNKLQELYCELRRKDEWLQEERTEREKLERERDCVRVSTSSQLFNAPQL